MKGLAEEVREIMKEYIGDNSVAGVTVLAVQDGKEICDCQEGMADIENGRVMKRDTIFRLSRGKSRFCGNIFSFSLPVSL